MRLFIGIGLAEEAKASLLDVLERLERFSSGESELRWSTPESWHVTLQFLGKTSEEQARCAVEKLGTVRAERVPVRIEGLGFFERAGVFWAGVALTPELLALQQKVVTATRGCGFVSEERVYRPHITLARVKGRAGGRAPAPLQKAVERSHPVRGLRVDKDGASGGWVQAEFKAEEFLLYESIPGAGGSRYEERARYPLANSVERFDKTRG
ncbi:MAG TPA: RNA 2',3'-cyclic phosphodiesterase [Acidobacteriaceae bacterium]|jgi:2'-5' RNA ligase|nr:RNA 2',3'-cyclic phosphodiesterase [Acidobacteriaceae bacterium]